MEPQTPYEATHDAITYAIALIRNYEDDIRRAISEGKLPEGYCHGEIYRDAIPTLLKLRAAIPKVTNGGVMISLAGAPWGTEITSLGADGSRLHVKVPDIDPATLPVTLPE